MDDDAKPTEAKSQEGSGVTVDSQPSSPAEDKSKNLDQGQDTEKPGEKQDAGKKTRYWEDRFEKFYPQFKQLERKHVELEAQYHHNQEDLQTVVDHSKGLQSRLDKMEGSVPRPDPTEDPEAYDNFIMDKIRRKQSKGVPIIPKREVSKTSTQSEVDPMEAMVRLLHKDYDDVIAGARVDIQNDPALLPAFQDPTNAYKGNMYEAAYQHSLEKRAKVKSMNEYKENQSRVERENYSPNEQTEELSPSEKRMCVRMKVSEKSWLKSKGKIYA